MKKRNGTGTWGEETSLRVLSVEESILAEKEAREYRDKHPHREILKDACHSYGVPGAPCGVRDTHYYGRSGHAGVSIVGSMP